MTAYAMSGDREKCLEAGMNDHMPKPFDPDILYRTIGKWLKPGGKTIKEFAKVESARDDKPLLPASIPGIDIEVGLRKVRENRKLFHKLLVEFYQDHRDDGEKVKQALASGATTPAMELAHTLKGAAGTLGAKELFESAGSLESALRAGEETANLFRTFHHAFTVVMEGLSALESEINRMEETSGQGTLDTKTLEPLMEEFFKLLKERSFQVADPLPGIKKALGNHCPELFSALEDHVTAFRFEEAEEVLDEIRKGILTTE